MTVATALSQSGTLQPAIITSALKMRRKTWATATTRKIVAASEENVFLLNCFLLQQIRKHVLWPNVPNIIFQRYQAERSAYRHSSENAMATPMKTKSQTQLVFTRRTWIRESSITMPPTRNKGPVMTQWNERFRNQLAKQPMDMANRHVAAGDAWRGCQKTPMRLSIPHATSETTNQ